MNNNRFAGWQKVFSFTFMQTIKTPAMIFSTIFLVVLALISIPAFGLISGGLDSKKTETSIEKIVFVDETGLELESWLDLKKLDYDGPLPEKTEFTDESSEKLADKLKEEKDENWVLIKISYSEEEQAFAITGMYGVNTGVFEDDLLDIVNAIKAGFKEQLIGQLGIAGEELDYINHEVVQETSYLSVGENGENEIRNDEENDTAISSAEYSVVLIFLCVIIMLISMGAEQVASSVLAEKSSKVVEYLLINVRPLALMVGKILAMFVITLIQLVLLAAGFIGSSFMYLLIKPGSFSDILNMVTAALDETGTAAAINLKPAYLPAAIVIVLLGALFFCTIAALAGASVSRMEELTECMKLFSLIMIVGAYGGMAVSIADMVGHAPLGLSVFAELFPLTSVFLVPGYLILGHVSLGMALVSIVILAISVLLLFMFSANVYETMIYHKGNPLKLKDILAINKETRRAGK